jgi:outer membrane protein assembly factor BamD (BamD/ComL family)
VENTSPQDNRPPVHSYNWIYPIALGIALALTGLGLYLALDQGVGWAVFAAGCVSAVAVLVAWPLGLMLHSARQHNEQMREQLLTTLTDRLQQIAVLMELISEQQLLSDRAKAIAFRDKDRDALRRAIQEDIARQDWEAAAALVESIEREFGYRQEGERFREMINERRRDATRRQITDAMAGVERHMRSEQWNLALREADRLLQQYPDEPQVQNLPAEIESRRQAHKRRLLDSWNEAVNRHDVDGSIEILKQLDLYLTPSEAENMQETARSLFREKLNGLRDAFTRAIQEQRHVDALHLAETIQRDFPNSGIARELKDRMDALRQRAAEQQAEAASA